MASDRLADCIRSAGASPASGYTNQRCRCADCTEGHRAQQERNAAARAERLAADPSLAVHGRASTYQNWGCRCEPCRQAEWAARAQRQAYYKALAERRRGE